MDRPPRPLCRRQRPRQPVRRTDGRGLRVVAERRQPPDLDRFVAALLALVLAEIDAERREGAGDEPAVEQSSGR